MNISTEFLSLGSRRCGTYGFAPSKAGGVVFLDVRLQLGPNAQI